MNEYLVTIIIVNWNTKALTANCIQSILAKNKQTNFEIIVVDNASSDGSVAFLKSKFPEITLIENTSNVGFSRANNQAIKKANGKFILLLNSDTEMLTREPLLRLKIFFAKNPNVGIVGATLVLPDGKIQSAGRKFLSLKNLIKQQFFFGATPGMKSRKSEHLPFFADYVDGAFLAIRRQVISEIGLLNEDYFMFGEDMEWCARAQKAGWKVMVLPGIQVLHYHGASSRQNFRQALQQSTLNVCRFISRYYGEKDAKIGFDVFLAGMFLRIPLSILRKNGLAKEYLKALQSSSRIRRRLKYHLQKSDFE